MFFVLPTELSFLFLVAWAGMGRDGSGLASKEEEGSLGSSRWEDWRAIEQQCCEKEGGPVASAHSGEGTFQASGSLGSPHF